jgi:hypothetical protein
MSTSDSFKCGLTVKDMQVELQRQPHIFLQLAENSLTVAERLK